MKRSRFEQLVREGFLLIPESFRNKIKNVALLVEGEPSKEILEEQGLGKDETLLGLYQGIPATVRGSEYGVGATLPDTITIFQNPIEEVGKGDDDLVRQIVAETVMHECAHYFGMTEDEVSEWERKKGFSP